jgi:EAL domain-containing protein (putative c-di-GMP-specific phosphodiesterase class I)
VKIAVDDFGTGYSSLSYLSEFPVDNLKIDKSFVMNMNNGSNSKIIRTIINLGNILGLKVIAEGTETREQVRFLVEKKCHFYQGNFFSHPAPYENVIDILTERNPYKEVVTLQEEDL